MRRRQRGFTLLEAIVALVLIGSAGMALFGWLNSSLISLSRIRDANAIAEAKLNVLEFMNTVNPMLKPEGEVALGTYRARWKAEATTAIQDNVGYPRGIGLYQLALYRTAVKVERDDGAAWFEFALKQVGYKKVREVRLPF
ncbi:type II secretion system protein [Methylomagnum sp.]